MRLFLMIRLVLEVIVIIMVSSLWGVASNFGLQQLQPTLYYYSRTDDQNFGDVLLVSTPDGSTTKLLDADGNFAYQNLQPNSDGSRYAVAYGNDIWIYEVATGHGKRITNFIDTKNSVDAIQPNWSPDEQWIAFAVSSNTGQDLSDDGVWVVKVDGTGLEKIAAGAGLPQWSPDGRLMFLWSQNDKSGTYIGSIEKQNWQLYADSFQKISFAPDGQHHVLTDFFQMRAVLFKDQADQTGIDIMPTFETGEANPQDIFWSPTGEHLILTLDYDFEMDGQPIRSNVSYLFDQEGKQLAYLNEQACPQTPVEIISMLVIGWSPDGKTVAVRGNCMGDDSTEIFLYDPEAKSMVNMNITDNFSVGGWWPMIDERPFGISRAWLAYSKKHGDLLIAIFSSTILLIFYTSVAYIQQVRYEQG